MTSATAEVPSTVEELDGKWLTRVLGATVTGVRAEQIAVDSGFSSLLYRLHLTGDASVPGSVTSRSASSTPTTRRWSRWWRNS